MREKYISIVLSLIACFGLFSCEDYLDEIPKGSKIPETLADFEALIRDEYTNHTVSVDEALNLLNDKYLTEATLSYSPLSKANYLWDESADRITLNRSDETAYYRNYSAISSFNLIIENALTTTQATETAQRELWGQAKILRAMCYFNLANYYADTYIASTASEKLSVPVITSADINAPSEQVTIQELYDFILNDVEEAMPYLPNVSTTILHPNLGTAYAFLARVNLQMQNYNQALTYANQALGENNQLYDWVGYYNENIAVIEDAASYVETASPMGFNYVENYNFRHGAVTRFSTENNIPVARAERFEDGDARFLSRWKLRTVGSETYYDSSLSGYFNYGGITTVEMYLIKAECLARQNDIEAALNQLNTVRKTRILPSKYQDITVASKDAAMNAILSTKNNELIMSVIPFCDARRLNAEGTYTVSFRKEYKGNQYVLSSDSHLWIMPFPQGATENPGNGTITQNVVK